jgi:hypothetical protein
MIYLYPEHGHERLAIDTEELDKQIAWLHTQPMCEENEGIWNLLESIRELGKSDDAGDWPDLIETYKHAKAAIAKISHWEDDPEFPSEDWQYEVTLGNTRLGYRQWVQHEREAKRVMP